MFRQVQDFVQAWEQERDMTLLIFGALTDESLGQRVVPEGRSLGRLAWHITQSLREMMERTGLSPQGPAEHDPVPARAADIASAYRASADSVLAQVRDGWTDASLLDAHDMYGEQWTNGMTLEVLIRHQAHHRGQMTVLMRQAGLTVPGVYGPAREQWAQWGMPAQE